MAAKGDAMTEAGTTTREARPRRAALSPELIAILAVGVTLAGVTLTRMTVMTDSFHEDMSAVREDVRELRAGQVELRERMVRVEAKVDVLVGDWPPKRGPATVE